MLRLECGLLDLDRHTVRRPEGSVDLTPIECELVRYLADRAGTVVSREELLSEVWGYSRSSSSQAVHVAIRRLRKKIEVDPAEPRHLKTIAGVGWLLDVAGPPKALLGRDELVADLVERVRPRSLITLIGPGGIGKTRVARALVDHLGGLFVDLSACTSATDLIAEVALALDCPAGGIGSALSNRSELVVLDNVEQVVPAASEAVREWAGRGAPLVLTTRVRLGLTGEQVVSVEPLDPGAAAALFEQRARAAGTTRALDGESVRSLCVALEGNPLCIELAAARARLLDPAAIEARLADRFSVLRSRETDRPDRHLTLEAVIDGSWQLLDDDRRAALSALCSFRGGCTAQAAEAVVGDLDRVQALVDASLCRIDGDRIDLYTSVREFVIVRRPPDAEALDRHGAWFAQLVHDPDPAGAPSVERWAARASEVPNLVAAARRDLQSGDPRLVQLGIGLGTLALKRHVPDVEILMCAAIERAQGIERARLLRLLAWLRVSAGDVDDGLALLDQADAATDDPVHRGMNAEARTLVHLRIGQYDRAEAALDEAEHLLVPVGHPYRLASVASTRGLVEQRLCRLDRAAAAFRDAIVGYGRLGDRRSEAIALGNLAGTLLALGRYAEARDSLRRCIEVLEQAGDVTSAALMWCNLGEAQLVDGDVDLAEASAERAAELGPSDGRTVAATRFLEGRIARVRGRLADAHRLVLEAIRTADHIGYVRSSSAYRVELAHVMRLEGDAPGAAATAEEAVRNLERIGDVHQLILALCERRKPGDVERARELLAQGRFAADSEPGRALRTLG